MKKAIACALILMGTTTYAKKVGDYQIAEESLCHGYPKLSLTTPKGTCVGLVASKEDGLKRPRRILALSNGEFIITDMVGWVANKGIVWRFNPATQSLTKIFTGIDHAHGLALGPDGKVYVGSKGEIFSFDPNQELPQRKTIINDLPTEGNHPLTHFIFDNEDNLIVNVGAPSDQCLDDKDRPQYPCPQSEGENPEAVLRKYTKDSDYKSYSILARGLRNSMALAIEPLTNQLFQGENGMDFKDASTPLEEINLIQEGQHYGWPYCYEDGKLNPKYKRTLFNRRIPKIKCSKYTPPIAHLPAHSAPLDMMFYSGDMFKELEGKLIVSLHGYRETGHRIVSLDMSEQFVPMEKTRNELVTDWTTESGLTPKGSPVGMTIASDGSIWMVEDKNKTILVFSKGENHTNNNSNIVETVEYKKLTNSQKKSFSQINKDIFQESCSACHDQFDGSDEEVFNELVSSKLMTPGSHQQSMVYLRMINEDNGNLMPLGSDAIDSSLTNKLKQFIDALKTP